MRKTKLIKVDSCDLCESDIKPLVYDFSRVCCIVRFLLKQPTIQHRRNWLEYIQKTDGDEAAELVKTELKLAWSAKNA